MADDRMALLVVIEKTADSDLVREMLAFAAERLMAMQVEAVTGAPAGVRSPERLNQWLSRARLGDASRAD
jgi:hypothetical protein